MMALWIVLGTISMISIWKYGGPIAVLRSGSLVLRRFSSWSRNQISAKKNNIQC